MCGRGRRQRPSPRRPQPRSRLGCRPTLLAIRRRAWGTSVHVGDEFPAYADLFRLRLGDHAFRRRQDEHAEVLGRQVTGFHFSRSVRRTANRCLITPQLLMLPTSATRYRFPRPSSMSSNERMYSLSCMTFSTRPMSFDAGRIMHSAFPAASALRIVTMASLSASWSIGSLSCISGSRARTRSPGSTGGTGGARTAARCPACDRTAGNPSSARSLSFASLDHLDLEVILDELDALGL